MEFGGLLLELGIRMRGSTAKSGFKDANSLASFRLSNPELCEGYEGSQLKPKLADDALLIHPTEIDNYHRVIWIPTLCEGHEGSQ